MGTLFVKQKTIRSNSSVTLGLFFVALLVIFTPKLSVHAYDVIPGDNNGVNPAPYVGGPYGGPGPVPNGSINPATGAPYLSATPNSTVAGPVGAPAGVTSNPTTQAPATDVPDFNDPLNAMLYGFVITVFGTIFSWAGAIFDVGLNKFLLGFGDLYYNHNVGVAVEETWKIVRDLFNLTFIFGLVYIGFRMILDADDHHGRKMLVNLIGAALLVNFSLFIIKFLIDISDITAAVIAKGFSTTTSISNAFINVINLGTILKLADGQAAALEINGTALAYIFGIMIFFAVAAFVFAAGGILLIIRFIVLNIYLVFSPIMFIGWVFPSFAHHSKKYMDGFLAQAFFAPAYLLMLYLSYKVLSTYADVQSVDYGALFVAGPVAASSAEMAIPFFILAMIFLVASLVVAKNMGAVGANTAISIGNKMRGNVQSVVGRNTIGRVSSGLYKYQDTKGGRIAGGLITAGSLGMLDNRTRRNILEAGKKAKFGGSYSRADDKEYKEKVSSLASIEDKKAAAKTTIKEGLAAQAKAKTARTLADETAIFQMQSVVAGMSVAQLEAMKDADRTAVAASLTTSQVEALMKSDKIGSDDKAAIGKARKEAIENLLTANSEFLSTELTKLTVEQIEDAGADFINKYAGLFSSAQMDDIKKSKKFNPAQKAAFATTRSGFVKTAMSSSATASTPFSTYSGAGSYKRRKSADIAALGTDVLHNPNAIQYLEIGDLEAIGDKKTLERSDREILKQNIERAANNGSIHANKLRNWLNSTQAQRLNW